MDREVIYRIFFIFSFITFMGIRFYFQSKVLREKRKVEIRESSASIIAGIAAALSAIVIGAEYIFSPGTFSFAYLLRYPDWLRWLGGILLVGGVALQGAALLHLGKSFHGLVVVKEEHVLVQSGPYRWIRHPIYASYLISYVAGGILASNWVLTVAPAAAYVILVAIRMEKEEQIMEELFGQTYLDYKRRTGRLIPRIKSNASGRKA